MNDDDAFHDATAHTSIYYRRHAFYRGTCRCRKRHTAAASSRPEIGRRHAIPQCYFLSLLLSRANAERVGQSLRE